MWSKNFTFKFVFCAVLALGAVVAPVAGAAQGMSEGNVNVRLIGSQIGEAVFTLDGNKVTCTKVEAQTEGFVSSPASTLTVHQIYAGCTAFGFINATVVTTGCNLVESLGEEIATDQFTGSVELACSAGNEITIAAATCEVRIGGQNFTSGVSGTNKTSASPRDVVLHFSLSVKVKKVKDGFLCPLAGTGEAFATYTGETTGRGFDESGTQVGVTFEP